MFLAIIQSKQGADYFYSNHIRNINVYQHQTISSSM